MPRSLRIRLWAVLCLVSQGYLLAGDPVVPRETRTFEILVDEKPVGTHSVSISDSRGRTVVSTKSELTVRVLFYRYTYRFESTEVWNRDRLVTIEAQTDHNGKTSQFSMQSNADQGLVRFEEQTETIALPQQSTSYARLPPELKSSLTIRTINLHDGAVLSTQWSAGEVGEHSLQDGSLSCQQWTVDGDAHADLWFDDDGWMVRQVTIERGHRTEIRLTSIERNRDVP